MTTKITVDAHAGWPVEVTATEVVADGTRTLEWVQIVPAGTIRDFHIYDVRELTFREVKKEI